MVEKYQVMARRYRPQRFSDVVGQQAILQTLKNALTRELVAHAYLFSGSRGVGKTTLARLFAKALNCTALGPDAEPCNQCPSCLDISSGQSLDVIEIDGASNRGIDDIRQINETVGFAPSHGRYKITIIDEVHMLTKEAFNALLKTLEEPPEKAKFFFATTEPHKVLPTILSRCQRFDLGRITPAEIAAKLTAIAADLRREVEPAAIHLIAQFADGSLRDAESLFDQILCFSAEKITATDVRSSLGLVPQDLFFALDLAFSESRLGFAFELVEQLFQAGLDLSYFLDQLIEHYRNLTVCKTFKSAALAPDLAAQYAQSAQLYTQPQCLSILDLLLKAQSQTSRSVSPKISLEMTLLQIIRTKHRLPIEVLVRRLSELEQSLKEGLPLPVHSSQAEIPKPLQQTEEISLPNPVIEPPILSDQPLPNHNANEEEIPVWSPPSVASTPPAESPEETVLNSIAAEKESAKNEQNFLVEEPAPQNQTALKPANLTQQELFAPPTIILKSMVDQAQMAESKAESVQVAPQIAPPSFSPALAEGVTLANKHPSYYHTLMRFAAVELEGTFKN